MRHSPLLAALALLALLGACHREQGSGGLTADEEQRLDNAAAMLEANTIDFAGDDGADNVATVDDEGVDGNLFDID